jgi:hypothetical protein
MDIVVLNSGTNNIGIFLGYENNCFSNQRTFSTGTYPLFVAVGDFNKDTRSDIIVANSLSDNVGVFLGYGNGSFSNQTTFTTGFNSQPYSLAIGDFDNDTSLDIIIANHGTNNVDVFLGQGDGTFTDIMMLSTSYGSLPFSVVVGDFNNDKKLDLAVANEGTDDLKIFLQTC